MDQTAKPLSHSHSHLALRLQQEVDAILASTDDNALIAEFYEDDVFDLQDGNNHQILHHIFNERVVLTPRHRAPIFQKQEKVRNKVKSIVRFLFTPLY
jgi:hypothetical protein